MKEQRFEKTETLETDFQTAKLNEVEGKSLRLEVVGDSSASSRRLRSWSRGAIIRTSAVGDGLVSGRVSSRGRVRVVRRVSIVERNVGSRLSSGGG
jgi:hypothetical protein